MQEDQQDYQLINSVYLDNSSMELYHGRLDKRPNAIATRIRSTPEQHNLETVCLLQRFYDRQNSTLIQECFLSGRFCWISAISMIRW